MKRSLWVAIILVCNFVFLSRADESEERIYKVTVDYSKSIKEMINLGQYAWVHPKIKDLALKGVAKVEKNLVLLNFDYLIGTNEVLIEMKRRDLRPALLEDLLAFHIHYPEHDNVVALGTVLVSGNIRLFPTLYRFQSQEKFSLLLSSGLWKDTEACFLAVVP